MNDRKDVDALIAENEALRAKYQRAAESSEHFAARAERLAEALREARKILAVVNGYFDTEEPNPILQADVNEAIEEIDAALHPTAAQEGKSDE